MIEQWMRREYWERRPEEPLDDYIERRKILLSDYFGIIKARGLPIVVKKEYGLEIIYSKGYEFKEPKECDICYYIQSREEKKIRMIRIIDPNYPEGLISKTTFGVMTKCLCVKKLNMSKPKRQLRSLRREVIPEQLPYKEPEEEKIPF